MDGCELIVDNFAGGGGASLGIELALGRSPDIAINHDIEAITMHAANHPTTRHYCERVWDVDPVEACAGRPVGLAWFSPDCKHFSKAKGGRPVEKKIRGLAWVVIRWAKAVRPRIICLENVEEFQGWGPLGTDGRPCPVRRGLTFLRWKRALERCGYAVELRELRASDFGAPTSRKRLFVIARCDGQPIVWPDPTHGPGRSFAHRVAAECIEWSVGCPSIFERSRPLAENTLRRIGRGVWRYVINAAQPFIVPVAHQGDARMHSIDDPMPTVTGAHRGEHALVAPFLTEHANASNQRNLPIDEPMRTVCAQVKGGHFALVAPTLIETRNGEREGQAPRVRDIRRPLGTVTAQGSQGALVAAFLARHYGGHENDGTQMSLPLPTVTTQDHHALVTSHITKFKGTSPDGQSLTEPLHTVQAGGNHYAEVRAFLVSYYGQGTGQQLDLPLRSVTTHDRFGLVTVDGTDYAIADIGMRMLLPRELFRAQGFPDSYVIDPAVKGKPLSKTAQVRMCGNSVCPPLAAALVRAQFQAVAEVA
jgi:DNA (cytosine-5)-methyltransferase 1